MNLLKQNIKNLTFLYLVLFTSCSVIEQKSLYEPIVGIKNDEKVSYTYKKTDIHSDRNSVRVIPNTDINMIEFNTIDSVLFYVEPFHGGKVLLFGLPYVPVIPNVLYPITFSADNKIFDYHIIISCPENRTIDIRNMEFYRNKKKILYESIGLVALDSSDKYSYLYTLIPKQDSCDFIMYPTKYYLFTFRIRTFTTKTIEIKHENKTLLKVKRKKKLYHKIIFAS